MRRYITWFLLSGVWLLAAVVNALDGRSPLAIGYNILAALMFLVLAIGQIFFDKQGEPGKKRMHILCIAVFVVLVIYLIIVLVLT